MQSRFETRAHAISIAKNKIKYELTILGILKLAMHATAVLERVLKRKEDNK